MIADYLDEFYGAFGHDPRYQIITSYVWEGHESAWVSATGITLYDFRGLSGEGQPYLRYDFICECMFRREVAWTIHNGLMIQKPSRDYAMCEGRLRAARDRWSELNREYQRLLTGPGDLLINHCAQITRDLIDRAQRHEFIGESRPPYQLPDGTILMPTLASVLGVRQRAVWPYMRALAKQGLIRLHQDIILPA